ncbi:MAG TPA: sigma-70 family RNA polymerase sigma factor [Planctomycetota bacterium]|nr:sigma-70 family RNA polymerase sigma factor [Planctomycetota bacterium]
MTFSTDLFLEYKKRPGKVALARLLERHQDAVYSVCLHVLRHPQDAEDACQDVLLEVARQLDAIDEPERFAGWLYRTALHTALDVKRKRGRQHVREAASGRAPVAAPDAAEALHEGLAALDDTSRALVVEHYFGQRPLRELAAERGCSEVAVWKRIQHARERLKQSLGSAVVSALEGIGTIHAPSGLLSKALLRGGMTMAASGGLKLAIVAPLVLLAGAGAVTAIRRPEPPALAAAPTKPARPARAAASTAVPPAAVGTVMQAPATAKAPPSRRPYPYKPAADPTTQAAARTWEILSTKRMTIDEQNVALAEVLRRIAFVAEVAMDVDPAIEQEIVSFKVQEIVLDGALRLMLQPRNNGYEIRPDGSLRVAPSDALRGGYEREAQHLTALLRELDYIRERMDGGWSGVDEQDPILQRESQVCATRIKVPQGVSCLEEEFSRLEKENGVYVRLEVPVRDPKTLLAYRDQLRKPFLQIVEERTLGVHLEELARLHGLVSVCVGGDVFALTSEETAQEYRKNEDERKRRAELNLRVLTQPAGLAGACFLQDFVDGISRGSGLEVVPSEAVWDSGASVTVPPGSSVRQALDALKRQGFRWALREGKIFVIK